MRLSACWRRLDLPGHDTALLLPDNDGWRLAGTAAFRDPAGPACVHYTVELDRGWQAQQGRVHGHVGGKTFDHRLERSGSGWSLDGRRVAGTEGLVDLDYGFTPATNLLALRRAGPPIGAAAELPAAWFQLETRTLTALPQRYQRLDATRYRYDAPSVGFATTLVFDGDGFVRDYPPLWMMQD